jgi:hypothetical protein
VASAALATVMLASAVGAQSDTGQSYNVGPLTGVQANFKHETDCIKKHTDEKDHLKNYYPAIGAPEHVDSWHTGVTSCARFTGNMDGDNVVFQYPSETTYSTIGLVVFDGPDFGYLVGGAQPPSNGQYLSKFNAATGAEIWRTQLQQVNTNGQWLAGGSIAIHKNGYVYVAGGNQVWKIDRKDGSIVANGHVEAKGSPSIDCNLDGMQIWPDSAGTIFLKCQTRSVGCTDQGNVAMTSCQADYGPQPNTTASVFDPDTLEVIDSIELDQAVTARPAVTKHKGNMYAYMSGNTTIVRLRWDPDSQKLHQDKDYAPEYLLPGQGPGDLPVIMGDWIVPNQNAQQGTVPLCVVSISQDDPSNLHRLCPYGDALPEGYDYSLSWAAFSVDPDNSLVFTQEWNFPGVYAVKLDQDTGELSLAWSRPDWHTGDYFSLIGPADQRVVISQQINDASYTPNNSFAYPYTEGVLWADALTGETIAMSSLDNPSTISGSLVNVGYGGRIYTMGNAGTLMIYQVADASEATVPTASPAPSPGS